jgi:hypothetical protein
MKHARARAIVGLISISAGLLFAILPWRWIELTWGVDIDASSGLVEFLLAAIPLALGTVVLVGAPHCRAVWRAKAKAWITCRSITY